ncbi:MAG: hypothetical protein WDM88_06815 [Galbitalea sp.]
MYPLIILFASVVLIQGLRTQLSFSRLQLWVGICVISIGNALALHTNIQRYVTGADVGGINLDSHDKWWWNLAISPMTVWVVGSVAFALAVWLLARSLQAPKDLAGAGPRFDSRDALVEQQAI